MNDQAEPFTGGSSRANLREPLLAALPHLWIGLSAAAINLGPLLFSPTNEPLISRLGIASMLVFMGLSLGVIVYAWRGGWPLWSASWYFYAAWTLVIALGALLFWLAPENWILNAILILGAFAAMGFACLALFRWSRLHALLAALFLMPVAAQFGLEAIPIMEEAVLSLLFGILAALVAAWVVRSLNWRLGVALALAANLLAGTVLVLISFYRAEIPNFYGSSLLEVLLTFAIYVGLAVALYTGPQFFWVGFDRIKLFKRGFA